MMEHPLGDDTITLKLEADETVALAQAIFERMLYLSAQPSTREREAEMDALASIARQMRPLAEERRVYWQEQHSRLN